jgi:hypothetical protein
MFWVRFMPERRSDSELLQEGCRSYHKAMFAVMQFRREAQAAIRAAIDERIDDIAAAMKLDKAEISEGLAPYADPANLVQTWDGSSACVGLKYPGREPMKPNGGSSFTSRLGTARKATSLRPAGSRNRRSR